MPMYEVRCSHCLKEDEVYSPKALSAEELQAQVPCPHCLNNFLSKQISRPRRDSWPEDGVVLEHVAERPKRFRTRSELRNFCKEHGFSSGALL